MREFAMALTGISLLVLVMGLLYKKIKRSFLSEPIIALAAGVLLGPEVLNVLDLNNWGQSDYIVMAASQLTISMALMATALRVPRAYLLNNLQLQSVLIIPGMIGMCLISTVVLHLILGYNWMHCFLIAAVITPTDPVVASTIVAGDTAKKLLPDRIRNTISFDSGANDGLALPVVSLALLFAGNSDQIWSEWLLKPVLWESIGGIVIGAVIGYVSADMLLRARDRGWMTETALLSFSLSLGLFVLGFLEYIYSNGIIGVFAAGYAAGYVLDAQEDIEQEKIQESLERVFIIPIFVLFGLILPWQEWQQLGWNAVWVILGILLFRRLPVVLALSPWLKGIKKPADLIMVGWFGPIGVAALYYMVLSFSVTGLREVWTVGSLIVFGSTIVHGLTGYPFARLYSQWEGSGDGFDRDNGEEG